MPTSDPLATKERWTVLHSMTPGEKMLHSIVRRTPWHIRTRGMILSLCRTLRLWEPQWDEADVINWARKFIQDNIGLHALP